MLSGRGPWVESRNREDVAAIRAGGITASARGPGTWRPLFGGRAVTRAAEIGGGCRQRQGVDRIGGPPHRDVRPPAGHQGPHGWRHLLDFGGWGASRAASRSLGFSMLVEIEEAFMPKHLVGWSSCCHPRAAKSAPAAGNRLRRAAPPRSRQGNDGNTREDERQPQRPIQKLCPPGLLWASVGGDSAIRGAGDAAGSEENVLVKGSSRATHWPANTVARISGIGDLRRPLGKRFSSIGRGCCRGQLTALSDLETWRCRTGSIRDRFSRNPPPRPLMLFRRGRTQPRRRRPGLLVGIDQVGGGCRGLRCPPLA